MTKQSSKKAKTRTRRTTAEKMIKSLPETTEIRIPYRETVYGSYMGADGRPVKILVGYRNSPEGPLVFE